MLSIGDMGSGQGAYYTDLAREDYYMAGGEPQGSWLGRGAEELGLSGTVEAGALSRLFEGFHPLDGRDLIQNAGAPDHQPGWDLSFSAPKSVSLLWSQADEATRKVIQNAHFTAVNAALSFLEDTAAFTRRGRGGLVRERARLVIAVFEHGTSRAQDMQLHSHALVMNVCTCADGRTRTIVSETLYQSKMAAGAIYRAELACQLQRELRLPVQRKASWFEIAGVPQAVISHFSKRAAEILDALHETGYSGPKAAAAAALATRQVKGHIARVELFAGWQRDAAALGWGPGEAKELLRTPHAPVRNPKADQAEAIKEVIKRITEHQSYFAGREFVRYLAEEAQGRGFDAATVRAMVRDHLTGSPEIIRLGEHKHEQIYTTREMMDLEANLLRSVDQSKTRYSKGVPERILTAVANSRREFSEEQAAACRHACSDGPGSIRVISGIAGTGKTTLLKAARLSWELAGFQVHGAALAGKTQRKLSIETGIPCRTLHRTLMDIDSGKLQLTDKSILVVDEAGMLGTRLMERLVNSTERAGARLVLTGERQQIQPIDAGGPYAEIEKRLGASWLTEIHRQRDQWARDSVLDFRAGRSRKGLEAYAERGLLSIGKDRRDTYRELISAWSIHGVSIPKENVIFTGTRLEAAILNRMAQEVRMNAGQLGKEFVTAPEGGDSFHVGDRVLFTSRSPMYGVENGSVGNVVSVDSASSRLSSRLDSGELVSVLMDRYPHVRLGYAATTHKLQGATVERGYILAGGPMQDREITYVQTSRARGEIRIFADKETVGDTITRLARQMSTSRAKEMAHSIRDQVVEETRQQYFDVAF